MGQEKMLPAFLKIAFGSLVFEQRNRIERLFHLLKDKGLERSQMFGYHRCHFHVQLILLMHNIECLL